MRIVAGDNKNNALNLNLSTLLDLRTHHIPCCIRVHQQQRCQAWKRSNHLSYSMEIITQPSQQVPVSMMVITSLSAHPFAGRHHCLDSTKACAEPRFQLDLSVPVLYLRSTFMIGKEPKKQMPRLKTRGLAVDNRVTKCRALTTIWSTLKNTSRGPPNMAPETNKRTNPQFIQTQKKK